MDLEQAKIILTGFPQSGKTVTGKALAAKAGNSWYDLDHILSAEYAPQANGKTLTCRQIWDIVGEAQFRSMENHCLSKFLETYGKMPRGFVLSLGGGAVCAQDNFDLLTEFCANVENSLVVSIVVDRDRLFERMSTNGFPRVIDVSGGQRQGFDALYTEREKIYRRISHLVFNPADAGAQQAACELVKQIQEFDYEH